MILKILANSWKVPNGFDSKLGKELGVPNILGDWKAPAASTTSFVAETVLVMPSWLY